LANKEIQQGTPFYGLVDILGNPYLTGYEPIIDSSSNTIGIWYLVFGIWYLVFGIWYVGYKADLQELFAAVQKSRVLNNGFVAVRDNLGVIRVHSDNVSLEDASAILVGETARINNNSDKNHQRVQETLRSAEEVSRLTDETKRQLSSYKA